MVEPVSPKENDEWMNGIDWTSIASRLPSDARTEITTASLPARMFWVFRAACGVSSESVRSKGKSLMNAQIRRWYLDYLRDIKFYADNKGVSFEDAFVELATKQ